MIVDVNLALGGRDYAGREVTLESLLAVLADYRIDQGVCYHTHALLDPRDGNAKMAELAERSGGKLSVCAVLDPILGADNLPGEGTLQERLAAFRPACLRIFPDEARLPFHPIYWEEILEAANALGLPLIVDCDYDNNFYTNLPWTVLQYPNVKFILIRQGCCHSRRIVPLLQKRENIYFTTEKMLDHLQLEELDVRCGSKQLLFGSGYPQLPHAGALGLVLYAKLWEDHRENILYKNWEGMTK